MKILVYGYGNPGRQDDGVGPALISKLEEARVSHIDLDSNYQLNIEDAANISEYDAVIFVDATVETEKEPWAFYEIEPSAKISFSSHSISPESVLDLCQEMYDRHPRTFILAIPGYAWEEMTIGLTEQGEANLEDAFSFIMKLLENPHIKKLEEAVTERADSESLH